MDFSTLIPWVCASLNCASVAELDPWNLTELYSYAEEKLRMAASRYLLFTAFDQTTALVAGQASYELPASHNSTIFAAADGVKLRASTVAELEALDDNWEEAANATPDRWTDDVLGLGLIRVYPPPVADGILTLIYQQDAPTVSAASPAAVVPIPVADYLAMAVVEQARSRQGDAQMLDAAKSFASVEQIYEQAFQAYWGEGL